jgi:predicted nucleic acid-binding protein
MGLILDSSVLDCRGTPGKNARQVMEALTEKLADTEIGVWVITLIEMAPGAARADTAERKSKREKSIDELVMAVPVFPVTVSIALRTGQLDGENQARGLQVPLPDLLIGVTALELGYSVGTANPRHFRQVVGLKVIEI